MAVLAGIEPERVFYYFEKLSEIPHGSGNTKGAVDFCVQFAKDNGLEHYVDDYGNCIIIKEASEGYGMSEPVIIQGHLDMVCEKEDGCGLDMEKEGLRLGVKGDKVYAEGTTLGGDDGIAVAMALAILEDKSIQHPRIEALLTLDEEIGMCGASALDATPLKGKRLLNIDSEVEGVFTVSCAGGNVTVCTLPIERTSFDADVYEIKISGLRGGHSGVEIDKGRANANVLLGRVLDRIDRKTEMRICSVNGGQKDNAITSSAVAVIKCREDVGAIVSELEADFRNEFAVADPDVRVEVQKTDCEQDGMTPESSQKIITALCCFPNGIQSMSMDIPGLVKTSLNLGILKTTENAVTASFCVRSSSASEKNMLTNRLERLTKSLGGSVEVNGDYPAWEYMPESKLRETVLEVYEKMFGKKPVVEAIHAGLECGILSGKIPGLDSISFGPDLENIHTPRETMSISSVQRVFAMVLEILKSMK